MPVGAPIKLQFAVTGRHRLERILWTVAIAAWVAWFFVNLTDWRKSPVYTEETVNGNLSRGLLEGLIAEPWYYQYVDITPGPLVYGVLLTPLYAVMGGSNMFSMKLLGFLFAAGGAWLWIWNIRRSQGGWAAALFAAWMFVPPPVLDLLFHLTWANHMEAIFFSGLLYRLWDRSHEGTPTIGRDATLAIVGGFSVYFCLQNLLTVASLGLLWLFRSGAEGRWRRMAGIAAGFAAGFSPFFIARFLTNRTFPVFSAIELNTPILEKAGKLFFRYGPRMGQYSWHWVSVLFGIGILAGVGFVIARTWTTTLGPERSHRSAEWFPRFLLVYFLVYLTAYLVTGYEIVESPTNDPRYVYRYVIPMFPVGMAALVMAAARAPRIVGALVLAPFLVAGIHDATPIASLQNAVERLQTGRYAFELRSTRGDDYRVLLGQNIGPYWNQALHLNPGMDAPGYARWKQSVSPLPLDWMPYTYLVLGIFVGDGRGLATVVNDPTTPQEWKREALFGAGQQATLIGLPPESLPIRDETLPTAPPGVPDPEDDYPAGALMQLIATRAMPSDPAWLNTEDGRRAIREKVATVVDLDSAGTRTLRAAYRGMGRALGEVSGFDLGPEVMLKDVFGLTEPSPEAIREMREPFEDGRALWAMAGYRCLYDAATISEAPVIGAGLARLDLRLVPRDERLCIEDGPLHAAWHAAGR